MLLYTGKEIHSNDWVEFPICDEVVKIVEGLANIEKSTFYQYPMFEWATGIPILDYMTRNEEDGYEKYKPEDNIVEEIVEDIDEEEDLDKDERECFIISYESDSNDHNRDTEVKSIITTP